ncbi:phage tail spike protein [Fructobacillus evanidus]|uniref:phage tail spike protein n=1 Tax=Fructobacillus evanidus TaxID=3064281 RepID=UPI0030C8B533
MIEKSDLTEGTLDLKINQAAKLNISLPPEKSLDKKVRYLGLEHPLKDGQFLLLRLMTIKDNENSVDYSFYELAYQELGTYTYIKDRRFPNGASANDLMSVALSGSPWQLGQVNVPGNLQTNFYYISNLEAINTVTQGLGGEVVFYASITGNKITGRYMDYLYQQGKDTSKVFVHGDNLLNVDRTGDNSSVYTAILPRGKGEQVSEGQGDSPDGYGRRINIQDIVWSKAKGDPLDKPSGDVILVDPVATEEYGHIDGNERLLIKTYDNIDDTNELINTAYRELMASNHPSVQYSATVAETGGLGLGDTVLIMHNDRNLSYKTRVFEVSVDLVRPENSSLKLGDDLSSNSLTSTISSISSNASAVSNGLAWTFTHGGHNDTTYSPVAPNNPRQGNVWYKSLPNGDTELYYYDGNAWVLSAQTDSQWKNSAELNGDHTVYRGPDTPTNPQQGDTWYKDDVNEKNGVAMYSYSGSTWVKFNGITDANRLQQGIIDADRVNVLNLDANNISTGHLSANFIKGGQIDASQINVINLNVNSLIGNVSQFIQSNWNGNYQSVSINNDGMQISSTNLKTVFDNYGMGFNWNNRSLGFIGRNNLVSDSNKLGLTINLNSDADYFGLAAKNKDDPNGNYPVKFGWYRQGLSNQDPGFFFQDVTTFNANAYFHSGMYFGDNDVSSFLFAIGVYKSEGKQIKIPTEISNDGSVSDYVII